MINLPNIGTGIGLYAAYKTGTRAPAHYLGYGVAGYAAGWLALRYTGAKEAAYGAAVPICALYPDLPQCTGVVHRESRQGSRLLSHQPRRTAYGSSMWDAALSEGFGFGVRLPEGCTEGTDRCKPLKYWSKTTGRPCTKWYPWMASAMLAACPDRKQTLAYTIMAQRLELKAYRLERQGYTLEAIRYMKESFERNKRAYAALSGAREAESLAAAMAAAQVQESMVPSRPVPSMVTSIESRRDRMLHELDRPFAMISDNEILGPLFRACASGRDLSTAHHDIQEGCQGLLSAGVTPATMTRMAQDVESGLPKFSAATILAFKRDMGLAPAAEVSEVSKAGAMTIDGKAVPTWALAAGAGVLLALVLR
jgi:hypothetical protein